MKVLLSQLPPSETVEVYDELSLVQQMAVATNVLSERRPASDISALVKTSAYLRYIDEQSIVDIFKSRPHLFFDGKVFRAAYMCIDVPESILLAAQNNIKMTYLNCLEDVVNYSSVQAPNRLMTVRARAALELLQSDFE